MSQEHDVTGTWCHRNMMSQEHAIGPLDDFLRCFCSVSRFKNPEMSNLAWRQKKEVNQSVDGSFSRLIENQWHVCHDVQLLEHGALVAVQRLTSLSHLFLLLPSGFLLQHYMSLIWFNRMIIHLTDEDKSRTADIRFWCRSLCCVFQIYPECEWGTCVIWRVISATNVKIFSLNAVFFIVHPHERQMRLWEDEMFHWFLKGRL